MAERLREAVRLAGGPEAVAAKSGVPLRSLTRYTGTKPAALKLGAAVRLAQACGVRVEWLATGEAPIHSDERLGQFAADTGDAASMLLADLLENVVAGVELWLDANGLGLVPDRKARLIVVLYRMMARRRARLAQAGQPFPEEAPGRPIMIAEDPDLVDTLRLAL